MLILFFFCGFWKIKEKKYQNLLQQKEIIEAVKKIFRESGVIEKPNKLEMNLMNKNYA